MRRLDMRWGLVMAVMVLGMASAASAQRLLETDGIELRGEAQLVMSGGGTCNVLESDTAYEAKKQNHGAPMDIWRLDFSVRNGSGRWLDHLIALFQIESEWPDCTNWDGPEAGEFPQNIEWADSIGHIQESGRNVVSPGQTLTETRFLIVLRGDPEPRFSNWSLDFDFAAAQPPPASQSGAPGSAAATPTATAEQETVFWQSIMNSTNPAEFETYLEQFPNGVFRLLAQNRLAALRAPAGDRPAAGGPRGGGGVAPLADLAAPSPTAPRQAAGQDRGFLAIDGDAGRHAFSFDSEADALNMCGTAGCEVVATFTACLAVGYSRVTARQEQSVWTWVEEGTAGAAGREALEDCEWSGGAACEVLNVYCAADLESEAAAVGQPTTAIPGGATVGPPAGTVGAGGGQCELPGFPRIGDGVLSWCPASVAIQVRSFALRAAIAQCAIATGFSSTPEQINTQHETIQAECDGLAALGVSNCQCPPGIVDVSSPSSEAAPVAAQGPAHVLFWTAEPSDDFDRIRIYIDGEELVNRNVWYTWRGAPPDCNYRETYPEGVANFVDVLMEPGQHRLRAAAQRRGGFRIDARGFGPDVVFAIEKTLDLKPGCNVFELVRTEP